MKLRFLEQRLHIYSPGRYLALAEPDRMYYLPIIKVLLGGYDVVRWTLTAITQFAMPDVS